MTETEVVRMKIQELEPLLTGPVTGFRELLRDIHKTLLADAEVVTLLTVEEIGVICSGLSKQTMTTIVAAAAKSKTKKSTKTLELGVDL